MQIATILMVHNSPDMARDVLDSIRAWATRNILLVVDKAGWPLYENFSHPDTKVMCGILHRANRSPYKNMALGFVKAYEYWPDADWYNYIEYDAMYLNSKFKLDLEVAKNNGYSVVGFNHQPKFPGHLGFDDNWIVKEILGNVPPLECHKILGAITYYSNHCIKSLVEVGFFEDLLAKTATFQGADFPNFADYAVEEIIFPSAASRYGRVGNLSPNNGSGPRYTVRFCEHIQPHELTSETTLIHPIKNHKSPIFDHYRRVNKLFLE